MNLMRALLSSTLLIAALAASPDFAVAKKKNDTRSVIEHARKAVEVGTVDPARDLQPLLDALAAATKADDAGDLLNAIRDLGDYESTYSTAAAKNYLRDAAPPVLLKVAQSALPGMTRSQALSELRALNVSDELLDQGIAICEADTSADKEILHQRAGIIRSWKHTGLASEAYYTLSPKDPETERRALKYLSAARERISPSSLGSAASHGETAVVQAMLDAGVPVNVRINVVPNVLGYTAGMSCLEQGMDVDTQIKIIDVLVAHGAEINPPEGGATSLLFEAARQCPVAIVKKLIDIGVKVERTPPGFSPLQVAIASGKWDVATLLVDHGARISKKSVDELFMEKPTDPTQVAVLKKATGK
jgi:hypothetical protein